MLQNGQIFIGVCVRIFFNAIFCIKSAVVANLCES